ncbi:MAG: penicillin-binding protein 1C [Halobacteriovoraceae bacterium]|nr:penicillin-binding protein 1C [Halobacteriovoraceae bacterium]
MLRSKKGLLSWLLALSLTLGGGLYWLTPNTSLSYSSEYAQVLNILDRHGRKLLFPQRGEKFSYVGIEKIPKEMKRLFLLAEDQNFYNHSGIDLAALLRATWSNLSSGRVVSGASTISQQVVRIKAKIPRSFLGKVRVLLGAVYLEFTNNKNEILEYYLNTVPFGANLRGVAAASEFFFQKELEELSLSEVAVLSILPRAPSFLMKGSSRLRLLSARDQLLDRYGETFNEKKLVQLSKKEDLSTYRVSQSWQARHFIDYLLAQPEKQKFLKGDTLQTTLDLDIQREVKEILRAQVENLEKYGVGKAAAIVVESATGKILSYAGTHDFYEAEGGQYDSVQSLRQPGSAVKPFTYLMALEKGANLSDILSDIPVRFRSGAGTFIPRNYSQDFTGPRLLMDALSNSLNIPALVMVDRLGVDKVHQFYQELGFGLSRKSDHYGVGITLGNGEMSLFKLVEAFTLFPNLGSKVELTPFNESKVKKKKIASPEASWLISYALDNDVSRRESFGQNNIFEVDHSLSVKTGTSTLFRDNWTIGFNQKYTIGVWVGNMNQKPMRNISGITGAGPILAKISNFLSKNNFIGLLPRPSKIKKVEVCKLSGMLASASCNHKVSLPVHKKHFANKPCDQHFVQPVLSCNKPGVVERVSVYKLPKEYNEWMRLSSFEDPSEQIKDHCKRDDYRILNLEANGTVKVALQNPLNGAIYALDPNIPGKYQVLKVEALTEGEFDHFEWNLNGSIKKTSKGILDFPLKKGLQRISVSLKRGGKTLVKDQVQFTVL